LIKKVVPVWKSMRRGSFRGYKDEEYEEVEYLIKLT
jgi:hypothetical protein